MCEKEVMVHLWQDQGLGVAPFRVAGLIELPSRGIQEANPDAYNNAMAMAWHSAKRFGVGLGSCDSCGMGLCLNFVIRDANGKYFVVGSDCVGKTHDVKLISEVKNADRLRKKAAREAKREAERVEREARLKLELDRQREVNGGLTDSEVRHRNELAAKELKRQEMSEKNGWLLSVLRASYPGEFVLSMINELQEYSIGSLSPRCVSILRDIYAKSHGRGGSKKYDAAWDDFNLKAGIDPEE